MLKGQSVGRKETNSKRFFAVVVRVLVAFLFHFSLECVRMVKDYPTTRNLLDLS